MFNVGGPEVMVILLVALIVLGPQQLPKAIRSVTSVMNELRKVSSGFQSEIQKVMDIGATDTTGREVHAEDRVAQPTPGPGAAAADPSSSEGGETTGTDGTDASPGAAPATIDPADRAAG